MSITFLFANRFLWSRCQKTGNCPYFLILKKNCEKTFFLTLFRNQRKCTILKFATFSKVPHIFLKKRSELHMVSKWRQWNTFFIPGCAFRTYGLLGQLDGKIWKKLRNFGLNFRLSFFVWKLYVIFKMHTRE